jgi:hypothetical protein
LWRARCSSGAQNVRNLKKIKCFSLTLLKKTGYLIGAKSVLKRKKKIVQFVGKIVPSILGERVIHIVPNAIEKNIL